LPFILAGDKEWFLALSSELNVISSLLMEEAGNQICQRMGFKKAGEVKEHGETYNVYKGTVEDVRNGIKVRQNLHEL
jgi:hypothetical protein